MPNSAGSDRGNQLLDRLPALEFAELEPHLEHVGLTLKQIVHQYGAVVTHAYFPTTALLSILSIPESDDPVEVATIGREGLIGLHSVLGVEESPERVICQGEGDSLRVRSSVLRAAMRRLPVLERLMDRYISFTIRDAGRSIACNAIHPVEARACRWLLLVHDQSRRDKFMLTQEFWAFMLGVRRQTVTAVARSFQDAGLISYQRGVIEVRDRAGLEAASCECYRSRRRHYDTVLI